MTARDNRPLEAWLGLEREAVWLYSLIGARLPDLRDRAQASLDAHARVRDQLLATVGRTSPPLQPSYDVGPIDSADAARAAAQSVERRIQQACAAGIDTVVAGDRPLPLRGLRRAALAELAWGGAPSGLPGLR